MIVALFVLIGILSFALDTYFDYLWYVELGKAAIFTTALYAKSIIGPLVLLIAFLFLYGNFSFANRASGDIVIKNPTPAGEVMTHTVSKKTIRRVSVFIATIVAFFLGVGEANNWEMIWRWLHRVEFKTVDPIFSLDISFFFFTLPFLNEIIRLGLVLSFVAIVFAVLLYYSKGSLSKEHLSLAGVKNRSSLHLSLLAALIMVLFAASAYLDRFDLLYGNHQVFSGANYADLHSRIPMLTLLAIAALAGAALLVFNAFSTGHRAAIIAVAIYFAVLLIGVLYPAFIQKFIVAPNELDLESPQIVHNINATLGAYGLDKVEELDLSGDKALTPRDIENNAATIHSIRLWDHEPLLDALKQIQEIRTYYDFVSVDNDRYYSNGELQQFMLSPRELNSAGLPERNWINDHLSYTHGYGLALGPVNQMTSEGLPVLAVENIPPTSERPIFKITRPEIYFGELTRGYAIAKTGQKEFDYPSGEANVYAMYEGTGGVPVNSFFRKLMFAMYFKDINIVLSPMVTNESRFLYHREIKDRLSRLAPFLVLDQDPYLVISEGRLFWIQDAYTVSDRYPYSKAMLGDDGNYIRNSVKMVVDAYNGTVDMYIADPNDPMIQVYQQIYPDVFRPLSEIPADLRRHLRYPEEIFRIQTGLYTEYHMRTPQSFYNKEDLWQIPKIGGNGDENPMSPYYTIMRLPQEKQEEFILMLPFTPNRKDNLSAWMAARNDGDKYGRLVVYRFPKQKLVYGPRQIGARINQDAEISRQISLWDQHGSQVNLGNLLIIPIEEALLYIRPLYLRAESGKIPELKRVVVAYENKIAMEESLEAAIDKIFQGELAEIKTETQGRQKPGTEETAAPAGNNHLSQARETYDRMIQAQRQGDWAKYGEELNKLGTILKDLKSERAAQSGKKK